MADLVAPSWASGSVTGRGAYTPAVVAPSWASGSVTVPEDLMPKVALERILWLHGVGALSASVTVVASSVMARSGGSFLSAVVAAVAPVGLPMSGEGALSMTAVATGGVATFVRTGEGSLSMTAVGGYGRTLSLSGEGSLSVSALAAFAVRLQRVGIGSLSLSAVEVEYGALPLAGVGALSMTAVAVANASMTLSGMGALDMSAAPAYERTLGLSGSGSLSMTAVGVTWQDSGITKVGTQDIPRGTWTTVTGWSVRAGYPDTVIESDGIRIPAGTYAVSAQVDYDYTSLQKMGARVCLDGTPVTSLTVGPAFGNGAQAVSATVTLAEGLVTVEGYHNQSNATYRQVQPTDTWLTIEQA